MSEKERADIMDALKDLPEADKQFMLGYAAGRSAAQAEEPAKNEKEAQQDGRHRPLHPGSASPVQHGDG